MQERMLRAQNKVYATLESVNSELEAAKKTLEHMQDAQRKAFERFEIENDSRLSEIRIKQMRVKALQKKKDQMAKS